MTGGVVRVRFGEGQFLGADDLAGEQAYRDDAARRHLLGGHTWGVVAGLTLAGRLDGFTVGTGLAVDGYGRVLCVPAPVDVAVDRGDAGLRDVWLSVGADGTTTVCLAPVRATDPHRPPGVPPADLAAVPHRAVGPAPGGWPVYLGQVSWTAEDVPDGAPDPVQVDGAGRVLAGLTGESVTAPSGRARMQVGAEAATAPRFTVATEQPEPAESAGPEPTEPDRAGPGPLRNRLRVDAAGDLTVEGAATVHGDLVLLPPDRPAPAGMRFEPTPPPAAAAPWTVYRTRAERGGRPVEQLCVEIGHPGEGVDPALHRFVVGARRHVDAAPVFASCLSVDAAGTVVVHGDLATAGAVFEGPVPADPADPRFAEASAANFVHGAATTATRVDAFFAAALTVSVDVDGEEGEDLDCTITVTNTGSAPATDGQVHVVIALDDTVAYREQVADREVFAPGAVEVTLDPPFPVPADVDGRQLTVDVLALGVGPAANVVSARGEATVDFPPIIL